MRLLLVVATVLASLQLCCAFVQWRSAGPAPLHALQARRLLAAKPLAPRKPLPLAALAAAAAPSRASALRRIRSRLAAAASSASVDENGEYDEYTEEDAEDAYAYDAAYNVSDGEQDDDDDDDAGDEYDVAGEESGEEYARRAAELYPAGRGGDDEDEDGFEQDEQLEGENEWQHADYDESYDAVGDEYGEEAEAEEEFNAEDFVDEYDGGDVEELDDDRRTSGMDAIQTQYLQLQHSGASLDEYEQLLYTIITTNRTDHLGLAVELTTRFCQAGKITPATQGVKYLLSLLEQGVIKPHYLGLSTMVRWLNGLAAHGHGQKLQRLVEAVTSHPTFTPAMLLPGQLAEALSNDRSAAEWQSQFDSLLANVKTCFVPDLNAVIRWLGRRHRLKEAVQLLDAMIDMGVRPDSETYEFIANAAVRSVEKVASAKSMKALPPSRPELPEVVFVGRSNVGKSSLVNMVVNRKALASTSSVPGHTRSFNFYAVNQHAAHVPSVQLVDVPGLGYAHDRPVGDTVSWRSMLERFLHVREPLQAVFHLVDSRVGFEKADGDLVNMTLKTLASRKQAALTPFQYVIVLTKADKVSKSQIDKTAAAIRYHLLVQGGLADDELRQIPVLVTSSKTKMGRNDLWRYFLGAFGTNTPKQVS